MRLPTHQERLIEGISVRNTPTVCDYIGYRSGLKTIYISSFDSESEVDEDQSYLDKVGIVEDDYDNGQVFWRNILDGINFSLEEDVFSSEEVVVTEVSERSVEVSEVAVTRLKPRKFNQSTSYMIWFIGNGQSKWADNENLLEQLEVVFDLIWAGGGLNGNEQPVIYLDGMRIANEEIGGTGSNQLTTGGQGLSSYLTGGRHRKYRNIKRASCCN